MIVELAERVQTTTNHNYAWFGELWPWFLLVSFFGLLIVDGPLTPTIIGDFFRSSILVWQLLLVISTFSSALAIPSVLLDETLAA